MTKIAARSALAGGADANVRHLLAGEGGHMASALEEHCSDKAYDHNMQHTLWVNRHNILCYTHLTEQHWL